VKRNGKRHDINVNWLKQLSVLVKWLYFHLLQS